MSEFDIFVSSLSIFTLDHMKNLKINTLDGNTRHFDNELDLAGSEGFEGTQVDHIKPQKIVLVFPRWSRCDRARTTSRSSGITNSCIPFFGTSLAIVGQSAMIFLFW